MAGLIHALLLLVMLLAAAPWIPYIPLATLSAILVVAAFRMVAWRQLLRLRRWPFSDSSVFLATFALTVLADLTLAVEVGVVLAALLMVKRVSETSQITAVDRHRNRGLASFTQSANKCRRACSFSASSGRSSSAWWTSSTTSSSALGKSRTC